MQIQKYVCSCACACSSACWRSCSCPCSCSCSCSCSCAFFFLFLSLYVLVSVFVYASVRALCLASARPPSLPPSPDGPGVHPWQHVFPGRGRCQHTHSYNPAASSSSSLLFLGAKKPPSHPARGAGEPHGDSNATPAKYIRKVAKRTRRILGAGWLAVPCDNPEM